MGVKRSVLQALDSEKIFANGGQNRATILTTYYL